MSFCRNCGSERNQLEKFCRKCGSAFDTSMETTPVQEEESPIDTSSSYTYVGDTSHESVEWWKDIWNNPDGYDRKYSILSFFIPPIGLILGLILGIKHGSQAYGGNPMSKACLTYSIAGFAFWMFLIYVL